jgi:hypothetical protein
LPSLAAFGLRRDEDQAWHCRWPSVRKYRAR